MISRSQLLLASSFRQTRSVLQNQSSTETYNYKKGDYYLIPKKFTVDKKIAVRSYLDRNKTELSDRTFTPQKAWFEPYNKVPSRFSRPHEKEHYDFYNLETKIIWTAFDKPELLGMLFHDEMIKGNGHIYSEKFLDSAIHFTKESRYWRCIGITKPFFDKDTLRAHCWEDNGLQVGTLVLSQAMRHALMDLERAVRRKELGLEPNYLWDRWGPIGFIDGQRNDYLPRFAHNPYVDPDGVDITELDVLPFNTHEQIKERYSELIYPSLDTYENVFDSISHGSITLSDIPSSQAVQFYKKVNEANGVQVLDDMEIPQGDMRTLMYLSADNKWFEMVEKETSWEAVTEALKEVRSTCDPKIEAARLFQNTRNDENRVRAFFEEKCGFHDFMYTPDKEITAAVLCYLQEVRRLCLETEWGAALAACMTDVERLEVMGQESFIVYKHIEDIILDRKRRLWSTRFAGEANEETTLDYLLENFGRRPERQKNVGTTGVEFDREQEPIGRQVQRRILDSDKANKLAEMRKSRGKMWSKKKSVFDALHEKQIQNVGYGVR